MPDWIDLLFSNEKDKFKVIVQFIYNVFNCCNEYKKCIKLIIGKYVKSSFKWLINDIIKLVAKQNNITFVTLDGI